MNRQEQTIRQFGEQWTHYTENEGYYGSVELLEDLLGPLDSPSAFSGKTVVDIGSGSGRIVLMLAAAGAGHIVAVEPSFAIETARANCAQLGKKVTFLQQTGDQWSFEPVDYVVSFGVIHHIPDPMPTLRNAYSNLKSGGKICIWIYGKEGNELYLSLAGPLRAVTSRLPHAVVAAISWLLFIPLMAYIHCCRWLKFLPMAAYFNKHLSKLPINMIRVTIYDQLRPVWAKYYTKDEAVALLREAGFHTVRIYHRHRYSWTISGQKA